MGFTHDTTDLNAGVLCSAYKTLPSMAEKLFGQMDLAVKIKACDATDVARLVIEKHFLRDTKGNLRKFTQQEYRCVACNEKFRRPPLVGHCTACRGKVVFTISEGSVIKYLEPSLSLARKYGITGYLMQDLELLERKVIDLFGKDAERQEGLGKWFG
jgi:DNA polymerase II large subunit